jgi:hypothetical protein
LQNYDKKRRKKLGEGGRARIEGERGKSQGKRKGEKREREERKGDERWCRVAIGTECIGSRE